MHVNEKRLQDNTWAAEATLLREGGRGEEHLLCNRTGGASEADIEVLRHTLAWQKLKKAAAKAAGNLQTNIKLRRLMRKQCYKDGAMVSNALSKP